MRKLTNELGKFEEEDDVIKRKESMAGNLKPVKYFESSEYICCSDTMEKPKPKLCEATRKPCAALQVQCIGKRLPPAEPCQWSHPCNERDILFRPIRWRCTHVTKRKKILEPSLGSPIGVSKSSFNMRYIEKNTSNRGLQGFASSIIAFAEYFITPEIEWDEKVLNRILLEGQRLLDESVKTIREGALNEDTVLRSFDLCGNAFHVLVNEPFMMGQVLGQESDIPNLHWALLKFFKKFQFCLLKINKWYVLLWTNADVYFVFDAYGRRYLDLRIDRKNGEAVLICLRHIDNVSHLLMNLSGVRPEDVFVMRSLQIKSLVPCGSQPCRDVVDRLIEFEVLSPDHAILRARIHLGSACFKEVRMRQALPVAFCALINAKIDSTPTWDRTVLDHIIQCGTSFYKQWTQCDFSIDLLIQDVPKFVFGQFLVKIAVEVMIECGVWMCTPNYQNSDLSLALKRAFEKCLNLLVQIQVRTYAIWKKGKFYYVLDPYSHQCSLQKKKLKTGALHMCSTFNKLCCVFTQSLLELFEESKFVIHSVKITELQPTDLEYGSKGPCICVASPRKDADEEVKSLNESVACFETFDCQGEPSGGESDEGDLDSPGLSQTRLDDYSDMRRDLLDESGDESGDDDDDDDEDGDLDLDNKFGGGGGGGGGGGDDDSDDGGKGGFGKKDTKQKKDKRSSKDQGKKDKDGKGKSKNGKGDSDEDGKGKKDGDGRDGGAGKGDGDGKGKTGDGDLDKDKDKDKSKDGDKDKDKDKDKKDGDGMDDGKGKLDGDKGKGGKGDGDGGKGGLGDEDGGKGGKGDKDGGKGGKGDKDGGKGGMDGMDGKDGKDGKLDPTKDDSAKKKDDSGGKREATDQDSGTKGRSSKSGDGSSRSSDLPKGSSEDRRMRHQRRKQQDDDSCSSSDERPCGNVPPCCKPNCYPGFTEDPQNLAVVGSESGSYESLCNLLKSAFRCADRILTMTPWGNYVAFRLASCYLIYDGCTCNLRSIRHMDLSCGTAGLICFRDLHSLIKYIESGKEGRRPAQFSKKSIVDQICSKYCGS